MAERAPMWGASDPTGDRRVYPPLSRPSPALTLYVYYMHR